MTSIDLVVDADIPVESGIAVETGLPPDERVTAAGPTWWVRLLRRPKPVLVALDAASVLLAVGLGVIVYRVFGGEWTTSARTSALLIAASLPLWLVAFGQVKLYASRFITRQLEEFRRIARGVLGSVVALAALAFLFHIDVERAIPVLAGAMAIVTMSIERRIVRDLFERARTAGYLLRPVVVVGGNDEAYELCRMFAVNRALGYEVRGFVHDDPDNHGEPGKPHLGTIRDTLNAVRATRSGGVIIAATAMDLGSSNRLIRELTDAGIHVELSSTLRDIAAHRLTVRPLGQFPVVYVEPVARNGWRPVAKRAFDIEMAVFGLLVTAPVLAVSSVAIKLDSPGPVVFRQTRLGRDGRFFTVFKLRTMVIDAEDRLAELLAHNEADGALFKMRKDPRVTRVGAILRKLSVDELPQFWNVLRGEMSMVGPRPALPREVENWTEELHGRLRVQPGITGMWQVSGRSDTSFDEYARLDLYYVDNWSLAADLAIIAKTIPSVLLSKGAH